MFRLKISLVSGWLVESLAVVYLLLVVLSEIYKENLKDQELLQGYNGAGHIPGKGTSSSHPAQDGSEE